MYQIEVDNIKSRIRPLLPDQVREALSLTLSYKSKGYIFSPKYKQGFWDGRIKLFHKQYQTFGTGFFSSVRDVLSRYDIPFEIVDLRTKPSQGFPHIFSITPRDYQKDVVAEMERVGRGLIKVGTGGGKSICIGNFIARNNPSSLIIVPRKSLLRQFHTDLEDWLKIKVGWIGEGICEPKRITVATIQSLINAYDSDTKNKELDEKYEIIKQVEANVECLIIDEVHHLQSDSLKFLSCKAQKAYYRFGFSATPFFETEQEMLVKATTGRILIDIGASELIRRGWLSTPTIYLEEFKHPRVVKDKRSYQDIYDTCVVNNSIRNNLIVSKVLESYRENKSVLVAVTRIEHGQILEGLIKAHLGEKAVFVNGSGEFDSIQLTEILEKLDRKEIMCVIATTILGEGINIPSLGQLILAKASASPTDTLQLVGRVLRRTATKTTVDVIDIFDTNCKYINTHSKDRLKAYQTEPLFVLKKSHGAAVSDNV